MPAEEFDVTDQPEADRDLAATVHPDRVCRIWNNAMFGEGATPTASLSENRLT